jgi:hypothetical protein
MVHDRVKMVAVGWHKIGCWYTFSIAHMYDVVAWVKHAVLADIIFVRTSEGRVGQRGRVDKQVKLGLPRAARLEDGTHRTDRGGYLN